MAYLDVDEYGATGLAAGRADTADLKAGEASFAPVEWTIVRLAREDGLASLREDGRFGRVMRLIFGARRATPLASERLEALRRMAVLSWHQGYNVAPSELVGFYAAGYSPHHYDLLLRHIGDQRLTVQRRNRT